MRAERFHRLVKTGNRIVVACTPCLRDVDIYDQLVDIVDAEPEDTACQASSHALARSPSGVQSGA